VISSPLGKARFKYRTAAVIIHDGYVLLHRATSEDFWGLPGGRVEILESATAALARELSEELGPTVDARVGRLLWMVANFFGYEGVSHHELGTYYLVTLGDQSAYLAKDRDYFGLEKDLGMHDMPVELIFRWFALSAFGQARLYPSFLRTRLAELPASSEHLIHYDTNE
jgi:ADP-ribose pyrophosphatase YjhB (NUDIX family)